MRRVVATVGLLIAPPLIAGPGTARTVGASGSGMTIERVAPSAREATPLGAGDPIARWHDDIAEAAARFALPARWIARVMRAESGGATRLDGAPITSPAGAMGLMQLMPATWTAMRAAYGLGADPFDPHDNIIAGAGYLRVLYDRFGYPGLFAAYNAGPGRYAAFLAGARTLPRETRRYLAALTATPDAPVGRAHPVAAQGLFARRYPVPGSASGIPRIACDHALFAVEVGRACAP